MALRPRRARSGPSPGTIEYRFLEFHRSNLHIYDQLVAMCWQFRDGGNTGHTGISRMIEILRWESQISTTSTEEFKINALFASRYSRMIMKRNPELGPIFKLKRLRGA